MEQAAGVELRLTRFDRLRQRINELEREVDFAITHQDQVRSDVTAFRDKVENEGITDIRVALDWLEQYFDLPDYNPRDHV